ncbi:MAG: CapA family protein [Lachnospiraceae bacterium]|nr:CapA family protein [Lachnospiraceae bacterium]
MRKFKAIKVSALLLTFVLALAACSKDNKIDNDSITTKNEQATNVADGTTETNTEEETTTEKETTTMPYVEPEVDIIMVGDILLHDNVQNSGKLPDGTYNYDHMFANVKDEVQAADLALVNQEVILGGVELGLTGYPCFNGAYEVGDALYKAGFNVILHATNHTLDRGKTALLNCMNYWKKYQDVAVLGVFESQESYDNDIYVYEQDGIKIAILNYTYGTNGIPVPEDMPYAVALLDETKVVADIKKAEEIADFTVVCPHWGTEYVHYYSDYQTYWTNVFMNNGVDLVLGTHPHVIQPVEMLTNDAGHSMLVYYSLGNFINSTADSGRGTADRMIGGMAEITVAKKESGEVYIKSYGVEPLVTQLSYEPQQITTYFLKEYTEDLAATNQIIYKDGVFNLEWSKSLCREVFKELYIEEKN